MNRCFGRRIVDYMRALCFCLGAVTTCLSYASASVDMLVVSNQRAGSVSVLDARTGELLKTISVKGDPLGVAISQDHAWISAPESGELVRITLSSFEAEAFPLPGGPTVVIADNIAQRLYVSLWYQHAVVELDMQSMRELRRLKLQQGPAGLAIDASAGFLYVAERDANRLHAVDLASFQVSATLSVGKHPFGLAVSAEHDLLVSANVLGNSVSLIRLSSFTQMFEVAVGETPYGVLVHPQRPLLFVTNQGDDTVSVVSTDKGEQLQAIDVGAFPEALDINTTGDRLYVTNWLDGTVSVVDISQLPEANEIASFVAGDGVRAFGRFFVAASESP